jgi:hypothetical protein
MRPNLRRLIKRRNKRGAALVEAVVVIPFFIIIFASILFVGNLYKEKMRVMRLAKEGAWAFAMENCGNAGDPITTQGIPRSDGAPNGGAGPSDTASPTNDTEDVGDEQKAGGDMAGLVSKDYGSSSATVESSVGADGYIGGFSKPVKSYTRVMCNEAPFNGDIKGFAQAGYQAITNW